MLYYIFKINTASSKFWGTYIFFTSTQISWVELTIEGTWARGEVGGNCACHVLLVLVEIFSKGQDTRALVRFPWSVSMINSNQIEVESIYVWKEGKVKEIYSHCVFKEVNLTVETLTCGCDSVRHHIKLPVTQTCVCVCSFSRNFALSAFQLRLAYASSIFNISPELKHPFKF